MRVFRKLLAVSAAVVVAMASGVTVAHADSTPSVYTTPGGQIANGRLWNTTCEKYASNVMRCRAEIWATTVVYEKGQYKQKTGWVFNNLSYLPSPRASWAGNNLGNSNPGWTSEGRKWKTECDTPATGKGGCRSYMWVKTVQAVKSGSGYTYVNKDAWVFNNLVLFSSASIPAVTSVPAHILDQSRLSVKGFGPIQLGASMKDLKTLGYFDYPGDICEGYQETGVLWNRGIDVQDSNTPKVTDVMIFKAGIKTVSGAQVGMTYAEVKAIYGGQLTKVTMKDHTNGDVPTAVVRSGGNEVVFTTASRNPIENSSVITQIVARKISNTFFYDGC